MNVNSLLVFIGASNIKLSAFIQKQAASPNGAAIFLPLTFSIKKSNTNEIDYRNIKKPSQ